MKLVDKTNNWKKIDRVILLVNNIEINFSESDSYSLNLNCSFENISRGRCVIKISNETKKKSNNLFIHTDQPLMVVNIYYPPKKIEKLIEVFSMNQNINKKIRNVLEIPDNLMVNNMGYLYVKDKFELKINSIIWNVPII